MHFRIILKSMMLIAALFSGTAAANVFGVWSTGDGSPDGYLHVSIAACDTKICGTIVGAFNNEGEEDPAYEHLGKPMVWDMEEKTETSWTSGKIWAPDTGKTYRSKMTLNGDILEVSGCVLAFCRTMDWKRVE